MKFKVKLNAILVLVAIVALVSGVVISFVVASKTIDERMDAHLESVVILKEHLLRYFVESKLSDIKHMVKDRLYREVFLESPKIELRSILKERLVHKEGFNEFFILDLDGQIRVSTDENQEGKIKSDENYFIQGQKGPFVQSFYYDLALQKPSMAISAPINDDQGSLSGLLVGRVDLKEISDLMTERIGLGETGETYLVNKFNFMVTESRFEKGLALKKSISTQGINDCLNGKNAHDIYDNYRGTPVFSFYKWIPEIEVCLLAEIAQKEAFIPIQRLKNIIIRVSIGIVVLVIVFGSLFSKTISKPVEKLIEGTERIGKGDLKYRVELKSKDEFHKLAVAFNQMAEKRQLTEEALQKAHDELEIRVEERTAELMKVNKQLKREVEERKHGEEKIKASLKEKEVLLSEIHHRVKNNMQAIISLLNLQAEKIEDKKYAEMLQESQNRILSMALVHEQLYQSKDFANIDFGEYIKSLANGLFTSYGLDTNKVKLNIEIKDVSFDLENAIPCGLIINELVSNSLKHAFPQGKEGKISIVLQATNEDELELTISDDGVGIPENLDIRAAESMGLRLVKVLAEQTLEGKMDLDRTEGTRFHFLLKRARYKPRI